jgi:hypothetical protein
LLGLLPSLLYLTATFPQRLPGLGQQLARTPTLLNPDIPVLYLPFAGWCVGVQVQMWVQCRSLSLEDLLELLIYCAKIIAGTEINALEDKNSEKKIWPFEFLLANTLCSCVLHKVKTFSCTLLGACAGISVVQKFLTTSSHEEKTKHINANTKGHSQKRLNPEIDICH